MAAEPVVSFAAGAFPLPHFPYAFFIWGEIQGVVDADCLCDSDRILIRSDVGKSPIFIAKPFYQSLYAVLVIFTGRVLIAIRYDCDKDKVLIRDGGFKFGKGLSHRIPKRCDSNGTIIVLCQVFYLIDRLVVYRNSEFFGSYA